jgi:hypothetical protein
LHSGFQAKAGSSVIEANPNAAFPARLLEANLEASILIPTAQGFPLHYFRAEERCSVVADAAQFVQTSRQRKWDQT